LVREVKSSIEKRVREELGERYMGYRIARGSCS